MTIKKFHLGELVFTASLAAKYGTLNGFVAHCVGRHQSGDWGDVPPEDAEANETSLDDGGQLLSSYQDEDGTVIWVITEGDRSVTTCLFPEDY